MSIVELAEVLFPHLSGVRVDHIRLRGAVVRIEARTQVPMVACPGCGIDSCRVHSGYVRRLSDSAVGGREVLITVRVRRFVCRNSDCARKTFAEPLPGLAVRYARRTELAGQVVAAVGVALGGRAGQRLTGRLAVAVNRMTLIRAVRRIPDPVMIYTDSVGCG